MQNKQASSESIQRYLNDKISTVYDALKDESNDRYKQLDNISVSHTVDYIHTKQLTPQCEKNIVSISNQRDSNDKHILTEISNTYEELTGLIQEERKKREENDQASFDIIKEFVENARKELNNEKKEREKSEESFLSLLEDTCNKLQALSKI